jgi:hypothetical protein
MLDQHKFPLPVGGAIMNPEKAEIVNKYLLDGSLRWKLKRPLRRQQRVKNVRAGRAEERSENVKPLMT